MPRSEDDSVKNTRDTMPKTKQSAIMTQHNLQRFNRSGKVGGEREVEEDRQCRAMTTDNDKQASCKPQGTSRCPTMTPDSDEDIQRRPETVPYDELDGDRR
jgi:hypothetical protein